MNGNKERNIAPLSLAPMTVISSLTFSTLFIRNFPNTLEGNGEGFIQTTSRLICLVHFQGAGGATEATVDTAGETAIPSSGLRLHENDVEFELSWGPKRSGSTVPFRRRRA